MADTLLVRLSEDAFNGDAQFTLDVDGTQIAAPASVTTAHGAGFQEFTYSGNFGSGPHTVAVHFLNDAWGGSPDKDRNLYVGGITFDGTDYAGETAQNNASNGQPDSDPNAAEMNINGTVTFSNVVNGSSSPPPPPPPSSGLVLHVSEDAWNGDAQFVVRVDGVQVGSTRTATASHSLGQVQDISVDGSFSSGPHTVEIQFINDAWGGTATTDRNLYVEGITFNGVNYTGQGVPNTGAGADTDPNAAEVMSNGTVTFNNIGGSASPPPPPSALEDTLVLYASRDYIAQLTLTVDGTAITGPVTVDETHDSSTGQIEAFTYAGHFGSGPHTIAVNFQPETGPELPPGELYVYGIDFNGQHYSGQTAENTAGSRGDVDPNAAEMSTSGTVTFRNVTGGSPTGNATITGTAGPDILNSGPGNDTIFSGGGQDRIVENAGSGNDTVHFTVGSGGDIADLRNYGYTSFDDVRAHMVALTGGGTLLQHPNGETLTFLNEGTQSIRDITPANFTAANFLLSGPTSTLVLHVSEDAWNGDAQFVVRVDGAQIDSTRTATASHSLGQVQDITVDGSFGTGPHTVEVQFINDAWGGTAATDRNLYVEGITFNGVNYTGQGVPNTGAGADTDPNAAEVMSNGTVTFNNVGGTASPPPPSGSSSVVLHLSEDAFNGDAQFVVSVDGVQQGGAHTVTALHGAGQVQDVTIAGDFGTQGPGTVSINFINDAWGGSTSTDRNLYVQSIDVNGVHFQGNTADNTAANGGEAADLSAAVMDVNGTATFHIDHTAPPLMG